MIFCRGYLERADRGQSGEVSNLGRSLTWAGFQPEFSHLTTFITNGANLSGLFPPDIKTLRGTGGAETKTNEYLLYR